MVSSEQTVKRNVNVIITVLAILQRGNVNVLRVFSGQLAVKFVRKDGMVITAASHVPIVTMADNAMWSLVVVCAHQDLWANYAKKNVLMALTALNAKACASV